MVGTRRAAMAANTVAVAASGAVSEAVACHRSHAFTSQMCAGSRWLESQRPDALFQDPLAFRLAGVSGRENAMGSWVMVPRTRFGDDVTIKAYRERGCRQLVLLGAGMDARAWRLQGVPELRVFEVDLPEVFEVKEPVANEAPYLVKSRTVIATDFEGDRGSYSKLPHWASELELTGGFERDVPTVWLLEGLMMYLSMEEQRRLMQVVGELSASGSVVFHDAITESYGTAGVEVGGARFKEGSDDYGREWAEHISGGSTTVLDITDIRVDRATRSLAVDMRATVGPRECQHRNLCLFVLAEKP
ncbi:unnamed protein product [Polarella glacialis]|uniref:S-adenosyl-L-methionine-dependent methyltransferase n=1 Tax=Polarella glacialis TaxID=89957 RepID=A0A813GHC8_POLGL|nr:unnamed protein product [Polarella glacialis]CAE8669113.1 unnamed protein product [Polarella glacialis]